MLCASSIGQLSMPLEYLVHVLLFVTLSTPLMLYFVFVRSVC